MHSIIVNYTSMFLLCPWLVSGQKWKPNTSHPEHSRNSFLLLPLWGGRWTQGVTLLSVPVCKCYWGADPKQAPALWNSISCLWKDATGVNQSKIKSFIKEFEGIKKAQWDIAINFYTPVKKSKYILFDSTNKTYLDFVILQV